MAQRSLEEIIASDPRFKNLDRNAVRRYYNMVLAEQNPTALPEVVVTAKAKDFPRTRGKLTRPIAASDRTLSSENERQRAMRMYVEERTGQSAPNPSRRYELSDEDARMQNLRQQKVFWDRWKAQNPKAVRDMQTGADMTDQNMRHRINLAAADRRVQNTAFSDPNTVNLLSTLMSPSQIVGALYDGLTGYNTDPNRSYLGNVWESLRHGNYGLMPRQWAELHPDLAMLGNMGTDIVLGDLKATGAAGKAGRASLREVKAGYNGARNLWNGLREPVNVGTTVVADAGRPSLPAELALMSAREDLPSDFIKTGIVPRHGNRVINSLKGGFREWKQAPLSRDAIKNFKEGVKAGYQGRYMPLWDNATKEAFDNFINEYYNTVIKNHTIQGRIRARKARAKIIARRNEVIDKTFSDPNATTNTVTIDGVRNYGELIDKAIRQNVIPEHPYPKLVFEPNNGGNGFAAWFDPVTDKITLLRDRLVDPMHKNIVSPKKMSQYRREAAHETEHFLQWRYQPYTLKDFDLRRGWVRSDKDYGALFAPLDKPDPGAWEGLPMEFAAEAAGYGRYAMGYPKNMLNHEYTPFLINYMSNRFNLTPNVSRNLLSILFDRMNLKYGGRISLAGSC